MPSTKSQTLHRSWRLVLALIGGYALTLGYMSLVSVALPLTGVVRSEAAVIGLLTGMVVYVVVIIWCASSRHLLRVSLLVPSIAAICHVTAGALVGRSG
ncbi:MAG: hypothetical protein AAF610_03490 [Pseudomonadota bacterium]